MSVARTRHVLKSIDRYRREHRQTVAIAAAGLAFAALALAVRYGSLAGAALLIAIIATAIATAFWFRLEVSERSQADLRRSVADLRARLDQMSLSAANVPISVASVTTVEPVASDGRSLAESAADESAIPVATLLLGAGDQPVTCGDDDAADNGAEAADREVMTAKEEPSLIDAEDAALMEGDSVGFANAPAEIGQGALPVELAVLDAMPPFSLTSLKGEPVTAADLAGTPAVAVFWRPGCQHCQRLTPELVAWESLQGPRLVVFATCDGPTAFRAGLPGLVILDPGFTVGQAVGAPGTPAAVPLDAAGRPSGPVVAGASAVTTLLFDAMRDWAAVEIDPLPQMSAMDTGATGLVTDEAHPSNSTDEATPARPTVLLRRVEASPADDAPVAPDWDAESMTRRAG